MPAQRAWRRRQHVREANMRETMTKASCTSLPAERAWRADRHPRGEPGSRSEMSPPRGFREAVTPASDSRLNPRGDRTHTHHFPPGNDCCATHQFRRAELKSRQTLLRSDMRLSIPPLEGVSRGHETSQ